MTFGGGDLLLVTIVAVCFHCSHAIINIKLTMPYLVLTSRPAHLFGTKVKVKIARRALSLSLHDHPAGAKSFEQATGAHLDDAPALQQRSAPRCGKRTVNTLLLGHS